MITKIIFESKPKENNYFYKGYTGYTSKKFLDALSYTKTRDLLKMQQVRITIQKLFIKDDIIKVFNVNKNIKYNIKQFILKND